jgi:hypothetical protein
MATVLRITHGVRDFDGWKREGFDRDPLGRERNGVKGYRILRSGDVANVDLEFDAAGDAEAFAASLRDLWGTVHERFGWTEPPRVELLELVERQGR